MPSKQIVAQGFGDKVLHFSTNRGDHYEIDYCGRFKRLDQPNFHFHDKWLLKGFGTHWNSSYPTITPQIAFERPDQLTGKYVWDIDHGTTRMWGNGVRVAHAYLTDRILDCGHKPSPHGPHTTGTAIDARDDNREICWDCAADRERVDMCRTGRWTGYIGKNDRYVSGWTEKNLFPVHRSWYGDHNLTGPRTRLTVRFIGPDGHWWSGTHINSGFTQLIHCRKTKNKATTAELEYNGKMKDRIVAERAQANLPGMEG